MPLWTPETDDNLTVRARFDASILSTGSITAWPDRDRNQTASVTPSGVATCENDSNGYRRVRNNDANMLSLTLALAADAYEVFAVAAVTSTNSNEPIVTLNKDSDEWLQVRAFTGEASAQYRPVTASDLEGDAFVSGARGIFHGGLIDSTTMIQSFNGDQTPQTSSPGFSAFTAYSTVLLLGSRTGGPYADTTTALYEAIVLDAPLAQGDRDKIAGYLAHKWGLASSLPANHPYRNSPPTIASTSGLNRLVSIKSASPTWSPTWPVTFSPTG